MTIVAAGPIDEARDEDGKWTTGGGSSKADVIKYGDTVSVSALLDTVTRDGYDFGDGYYDRSGIAGWIEPDGRVTIHQEHRDIAGGYLGAFSSGKVRITSRPGSNLAFSTEIGINDAQEQSLRRLYAGTKAQALYIDVVRGHERMWSISVESGRINDVGKAIEEARAKAVWVAEHPEATGTIDRQKDNRAEPGQASWEKRNLAASGAPEPIDDETLAQGRAVIRAAYAAAIELVAPRIAARYETLTAVGAGDNEHIITDAEWAALTAGVEDTLGDAVLDGVVAGATEFGVLAAPETVVKGFLAAVTGFADWIVSLREKMGEWIKERAERVGPAASTKVDIIHDLMHDSPLSPDKADLVAQTELGAATNAGQFAALQAAAPAALRWVTARDERVRPAHRAADTETVPYGETFTIDGYPARFPGDPQLPFRLRVNCRCHLAYVDGTEARRIVGSTKAELRVKAAQMSIGGRSTMNKGELQGALLKSLCLQGLAGGPDCPDLFDQMNRTTLLAFARGEGIVGRYRMTVGQLRYNLRQTMRGGDAALVARGYGTKAEFAANQRLATAKRAAVDDPGEFSTNNRIPPPEVRRELRNALFEQYAEKVDTVTCTFCGLKLSADQSAGIAMLVPLPIVPWSWGGTLALSNLVPCCPSCFRARGGRGLVAAGPVDEARDEDGKWTDEGGSSAKQFATADEYKAARKLVADKVRNAPKPTRAEVSKNRDVLDKSEHDGTRPGGELRGNNETRKARAEALFDEFGGTAKGYVPCAHCGIKVSPGGHGGHAVMTQDKIRTAAEGGKYGTPTEFPNLIPACTGCNASRNDDSLAAAGAPSADGDNLYAESEIHHTSLGRWPRTLVAYSPSEPRDDHGRWTDGGPVDISKAAPETIENVTGSTLARSVREGYLGHGERTEAAWDTITAPPELRAEMATVYTSLPSNDPAAHPAYKSLADEVRQQYEYMTTHGIKAVFVDYDPYPTAAAMIADVDKGTIKVMKTSVTGSHPLFNDTENDMFRAVHDVFGHAASGRGFDRHGERAAFISHSEMFHSADSVRALASETEAQNAVTMATGHFPEQKVALMPDELVFAGITGPDFPKIKRGLVAAGYDPNQPRGYHGRWGGPGSVARSLLVPNSGFTKSVPDLKNITTGVAVALLGSDRLFVASEMMTTEGKPTAALLAAVTDRAEAAMTTVVPPGTRAALGAWHDPVDGKIEVNVTVVYPADRRADAIAFGRTNNQIFIYDIDHDELIDTGGTGGDRTLDSERDRATESKLKPGGS